MSAVRPLAAVAMFVFGYGLGLLAPLLTREVRVRIGRARAEVAYREFDR